MATTPVRKCSGKESLSYLEMFWLKKLNTFNGTVEKKERVVHVKRQMTITCNGIWQLYHELFKLRCCQRQYVSASWPLSWLSTTFYLAISLEAQQDALGQSWPSSHIFCADTVENAFNFLLTPALTRVKFLFPSSSLLQPSPGLHQWPLMHCTWHPFQDFFTAFWRGTLQSARGVMGSFIQFFIFTPIHDTCHMERGKDITEDSCWNVVTN